MGGSSLAPEVLRQTFGGGRFHVLDTTHPAAIRAVESQLDLARTLFISASKSGGTLETRSHTDYFWKLAPRGAQWVAVTDPGSELERLARERSFRATFPGEPTIGGRYSALSPFGLVPAALMGIDLRRLLERAVEMAEACRLGEGNPGLELGLSLGHGWEDGRDKVCVPNPHGFGLWAEQLVAESTGKDDKGLVPAPGESPDGPDRQAQEARVESPYELGQEFFRWEFGVAVAGSILGINPFDQPNVQAAKDKTGAILAAGEEPSVEPEGSLDELLAGAQPGDYVAILAFVNPTADAEARLAALAARAREATGCVVTTGFGPRYLHSTGQLHKGGANNGIFVQVVDDTGEELDDPRPAVRLRPPDPRAGRRRPRVAPRPRQARLPHPHGGALAMQLGMIGLGRMGGNMATRLEQAGHELKTYDPGTESTAASLAELRDQLDAPRAFWLMVPSGDITESTFQEVLALAEAGDAIVDGGNSNFRDSQRRHAQAAERGVHFVDAGVSGGVWGLKLGYCLMVGGEAEAVQRLEPVFTALAPEDGYAHVGPSGAGPLREDDPQRDRVRPDAGLRRGLRGPGEVRVRPRPDARSRASGATARSCARGCSSCSTTRSSARAATCRASGAGSPTRARAAGRSPRRSPRTCRCR